MAHQMLRYYSDNVSDLEVRLSIPPVTHGLVLFPRLSYHESNPLAKALRIELPKKGFMTADFSLKIERDLAHSAGKGWNCYLNTCDKILSLLRQLGSEVAPTPRFGLFGTGGIVPGLILAAIRHPSIECMVLTASDLEAARNNLPYLKSIILWLLQDEEVHLLQLLKTFPSSNKRWQFLLTSEKALSSSKSVTHLTTLISDWFALNLTDNTIHLNSA